MQAPSHDLALRIDHSLLKPQATASQIRQLCAEAKEYGFYAICVQPFYLPLCRALLLGSEVRLATVCAFPHGTLSSQQKAAEAKTSLQMGADEIDMVINLGALLSDDWQAVEADISAVRVATQGHILKVILETSLLSDQQKRRACQVAVAAEADFVKTSTGFGSSGANLADVQLMREVVAGRAEVKASGGISKLADALVLLQAGATRLGTSSGVKLVQEQRQTDPDTDNRQTEQSEKGTGQQTC